MNNLESEIVKKEFFKYLDTVTVDSPDYSSLSYLDIQSWGKVCELIKYRNKDDILCERNNDETDYRCWSWDVYVKTGTFKIGKVIYFDKATLTNITLDVEYQIHDKSVYCHYKIAKLFFIVPLEKLIN